MVERITSNRQKLASIFETIVFRIMHCVVTVQTHSIVATSGHFFRCRWYNPTWAPLNRFKKCHLHIMNSTSSAHKSSTRFLTRWEGKSGLQKLQMGLQTLSCWMLYCDNIDQDTGLAREDSVSFIECDTGISGPCLAEKITTTRFWGVKHTMERHNMAGSLRSSHLSTLTVQL
jgi:hypothetical protein